MEFFKLPHRPPPGKPWSSEIVFTTDYTLLRPIDEFNGFTTSELMAAKRRRMGTDMDNTSVIPSPARNLVLATCNQLGYTTSEIPPRGQ